MRFGVLGALQVLRDGEELDLTRRQERVLLARLLVDVGRPVAVDRLIDDLWGDDPPPSATGSLHAYVSRLRRVLEPDRPAGADPTVLVTRSPGYALLLGEGHELDARRFEELAARGRDELEAGDPRAALATFDEAVALWRGDVLADLVDEPFVVPVAARLQAVLGDVREQRAGALLATGATAQAIADLEVLTAGDVVRERAWELLLTALHTAGRTVEALERYRRLRERLADELGLDPGAQLQALEAAMLRGDLPRPGPSLAPPIGPAAPAAPPPEPVGRSGPVGRSEPALPGTSATVPPTDGLVGRATELAQLEEALGTAAAGRTVWAVLLGDAGIGKTRLVQQLTEGASRRGTTVVVGRCHEANLAPAFWPWVQAMRGLEQLVPGAATILEEEETGTGDSAARLFSLFDRLAGALAEAATSTPLLVVLEDLHWADPESLQLIDFLAVQLQEAPIAFALTTRRGEIHEALRSTLAEVARQPGHVRLDLVGLDAGATSALIRSVTGAAVDADLVTAVQERTGGNPFFVTELARLGRDALAGKGLPDTILEVLTRRLDRLAPGTRELLTLAAVHGAEFDLDALVATSEADETTVLDGLDAALEVDLLTPAEDPSRLRFAHALVREAALVGLTDLRRRRLHLRIATSLRASAPDDPTAWLAEVAHHLLAAAPLGDAAETLGAARAAAEHAQARLAFHEAARWWEGALRVLEWDRTLGTDQRLRHDLLVALGCSLGDAGDRPAALQRLAEAIDVADALGDVRAAAEAAMAFERTAGFWYWAEYGARSDELVDRLHHVLGVLGDDEPALRVRVLLVAASGEYYSHHDERRRLAEEALQLARGEADPELIATALLARIRADWHHHDLAEKRRWTDELLRLGLDHRLPEIELLGWVYRMAWAQTSGDVDEAEQAHRRAVSLAERLGLVIHQAQLGWAAPTFARARGDAEEAARRLATARELHTRTRLYSLDVMTAWNRVTAAWDAGSLHDITDDEREAFAEVFPEGEVALRLRDGDRAGARSLLEQVLAERPLQPLFDALGLAVIRASLVADLEAVDLAPALLAELEPYPTYLGALGTCCTTWPVALELGRLQSLLGDHAAAVATLEAGLVRAEDAGWVRWAARLRAALSEVRERATPAAVTAAGA